MQGKLLSGIRTKGRRLGVEDAGTASSEYAIATIAAAAFAAVLYVVITGDSVAGALEGLVRRALNITF